jgi:AraC-like DNA-binding protein
MQTYDVAGYHIRGFLEGLRGLGLAVDELLREFSFDRALLEDPEVRFAETQVLTLWLHAEQRYGKPSFGFDLAMRIPLGKLELIDYLVAACPTAGAGIECLDHHARLCASGFTYAIQSFTHEGESGRRILAAHHHPLSALPRSMSEYTWTLIVSRLRRACGQAFAPVLWLRERPNVPAAELLEALGRVPETAEEEALFVSDAQWKLDNARRDPMLQNLMLAHARDVAARLPEPSFLSSVQGAIVSAMHRGDAGIERVATRIGLTPRTLQRRLALDGLTYQQVLEQLRRELALQYLATARLSLTEISALLAYTDTTAFGRAFRRWTGRTPAAFRQAQAVTREPVPQAETDGAAN